MASQAVTRTGPRLGKKALYLPNFTLTLLRTPTHPPTFASFIVPLSLNKLDLRDYLHNVYGVSVRGVRSFIQMQKLRQDKPGAKNPRARRWFRPRSIKKMMVELEEPFAWPKEPSDYDLWDKKTYDAAQKDREIQQEEFRPHYREKPSRERASVAEQAKASLKGDTQWRNSPPAEEWEDVGEAQEVETGIDVSKAIR